MKDYNQRTSNICDDRDGDTITSLGTPLIKTCEPHAPDFAFFLVPTTKEPKLESGVPEIDMVVESYVKMSSLPKDIAQSVRQALQGK